MQKRTPEELDHVIAEVKEAIKGKKFRTVSEACKAYSLNISSYYTRSHKKKPEPRTFYKEKELSETNQTLQRLMDEMVCLQERNKKLQEVIINNLLQ